MYQENYHNFLSGIWCFILDEENNHELNHLKNIPEINYGYISDDAIVYDVNLEEKYRLCNFNKTAFYLPKSQICKIKVDK